MSELTSGEEFFGLRSRPFSLTPDLRFTYQSHSHSNAVEQISQALKRREGLVVVTGEVGTGKTMLCRTLLETFETRTFLSVILDPMLTAEDLLNQVLADFGLVTRNRTASTPAMTDVARHELVSTLQKFLASLIPLNAHAVIMIDEAQHLAGPVLEQVRLLSNFETDSAKLLQIVLVGQPDLDMLLERPDMQQLNQRVARRCVLEPLSESEVKDYIDHRLLVASEDPAADARGERNVDLSDAERGVQFSPAAVKLVATISRGLPRLVNTLCDRALDIAHQHQQHIVDRNAVVTAADNLRLPVPSTPWVTRRNGAIAAGLAALAIGLGWWWNREPALATPQQAAAPVSAPALAPAPPPPPIPDAAPTTAAPAQDAAAAPATPKASPTPAPVTPAPAGGFEIMAASFKTEERASVVALSLTRYGLPVTTRADASGAWHRVIVGPFTTREDALDAQQQLDAQGFGDTRIVRR